MQVNISTKTSRKSSINFTLFFLGAIFLLVFLVLFAFIGRNYLITRTLESDIKQHRQQLEEYRNMNVDQTYYDLQNKVNQNRNYSYDKMMIAGSLHYLGYIFNNDIIITSLEMKNNRYIIKGLANNTDTVFNSYNKLLKSEYYQRPNLKKIQETSEQETEGQEQLKHDMDYSFKLEVQIARLTKESDISGIFQLNLKN